MKKTWRVDALILIPDLLRIALLKFGNRVGGHKFGCFGVGKRWRKGGVTTIFADCLLTLGTEDVAEEGFDAGVGSFARGAVNVGCNAAGEGVGVIGDGLGRRPKDGTGGWSASAAPYGRV